MFLNIMVNLVYQEIDNSYFSFQFYVLQIPNYLRIIFNINFI